jgi:hypothetical protein
VTRGSVASESIGRMATQTQVTLDLEVGAEPITGRLSDDRGTTVAFAGWLELAAALENAIRERAGEDAA